MAEGTVQLPPDSTGKVMRTQTNAGVASGAHQPVDTLADSAGNLLSSSTASSKTMLDVNLAASGGAIANFSGTLTGSNISVQATVSQMGNGTVVLSGGTFTGLPIAFEASVDGGTNWFPIDVVRSDGQQVISTITIPSQAALPLAFNYMAPGYSTVRVRQTATATTQTGNPTVTITQGPFLYDPSPTSPPVDGNKLTYSSVLNSIAGASATSGPVWELANTSATSVIRVIRIAWGLTLVTAGSVGVLSLQKRTAASTGGTANTQTIVAHDTTSHASIATSKLYTAAPTVAGSLLGMVRQTRYFAPATTLTTTPLTIEWTFGNRPGQALILRPAESINIVGTGFNTAPTITGECEWTEEA